MSEAPKKGKGSKTYLLGEAIRRGLHVRPDGDVVFQSGKVSWSKKRVGGYRRVTISVDGERLTVLVARIVCWQHHGPPPTPLHEVDHKNRDRSDDSPENLRWSTGPQNAGNISARERKRRADVCRALKKPRGEQHGHSRFTEKDVLRMRALYKKGVSQNRLAEMFGTGQQTISLIVRGITWKHLPNG